MSDKVLWQQDGPIVTLTLNDPAMRNPISEKEMVDAIVDSLDRLNQERQSIDANHAFGKWMSFVITVGCNGSRAPTNDDFAQANAASSRATAAKKTFVAAWKPVAARYGLPAVTETDL